MKNRYRQAVDFKKRRPLSIQMRHRLREGLFLVSIAGALFLLIALATYCTKDPGWSSTGLGGKVGNLGGRVGAWVADIFLSLFGIVAYLFPFLIVLSSWLGLQENTDVLKKKSGERIYKIFGWIFLITSACALMSFYFQAKSHLPADSGGIIGDLFGRGLSILFNKGGSTLLFVTLLLCGITLVTGLSWIGVIEMIGERVSQIWAYLRARHQIWLMTTKEKPTDAFKEKAKRITREEPVIVEQVQPSVPKPVVPVVVVAREQTREKKKFEIDPSIRLAPGTLPPFTLLDPPPPMNDKPFANISFEELSMLVEQRLSDFGVEAKVVAVLPGPVITRFELELAPVSLVVSVTSYK